MGQHLALRPVHGGAERLFVRTRLLNSHYTCGIPLLDNFVRTLNPLLLLDRVTERELGILVGLHDFSLLLWSSEFLKLVELPAQILLQSAL